MITEIKIPSMGATMEEGKIVAWRVKEGDRVKTGEILLEIETDKSVFEVESPASGVVRKLLAAEGDTLPVQSVIALVGEPGDAIPASGLAKQPPPPAAAAPTPMPKAGPQAAAAEAPSLALKISPRARKLAEQRGVDLRTVQGTGPDGRIESADVEKAAQTQSRGVAAVSGGPAKPEGDVIPFDPIRLKINRVVVKSKQEIPHFYIGVTIDASRLAAYRQRQQAQGQTVSVNALFMKAIVRGLEVEPSLRVALAESGYVRRRSIHVGLAIETPKGVMIAVVEDVDKRDLVELSAQIRQAAAVARGETAGTIRTTGACMTISNIGMYRADWFIPIIHPGEAAILGVGSLADRVVAVNGQVAVRPTLPVSLCVDHRIADGAAAARFLKAFADHLEQL